MDGEPAVVVVETPPSEHMEVAQSEAAVEIAQIAAARDVEIASINAESTAEVVAAQTEVEIARQESVEEWRTNYAMLQDTLSEERAARVAMEAQIASLTETATAQAAAIASLTPPRPLEPEPGPEEQPPESPPAGQREAEPGTGRRKRVWM